MVSVLEVQIDISYHHETWRQQKIRPLVSPKTLAVISIPHITRKGKAMQQACDSTTDATDLWSE
jgi:hypothetical protein